MTLAVPDLQSLVPHRGAMCLLDSVESWDARAIVCVTIQHRSTANPLRRDDRLAAVHAIEFAAQAAAVHGALAAPGRPAAGLLVSVRNCRFHCARLDDIDGTLRVAAQWHGGNLGLVIYEFAVSSNAQVLVDGRVGIFSGTAASP